MCVVHAAVALTAALALVGQSAEGQDEAPVARLTKMPVLTRFVEATYPPQAQEAGREGTVVLAIDVDAAGLVQKAEVIESAGVDFDDAALHAAAQFEFEPAEAGELGPVPVRITYRYR